MYDVGFEGLEPTDGVDGCELEVADVVDVGSAGLFGLEFADMPDHLCTDDDALSCGFDYHRLVAGGVAGRRDDPDPVGDALVAVYDTLLWLGGECPTRVGVGRIALD